MIPLNTPVILSFVGDGTEQIIFPVSFPTFEDANIEAEIVSPLGESVILVKDTHYVLDSIGIPNTDATFILEVSPLFVWTDPNGLKEDYTLKIKFSTNAFQPAKLRDLGRFAPEVLEKVADRLTMNVLALRGLVTEIASEFQALSDKVDTFEESISNLVDENVDQQQEIDALETQASALGVTSLDHESRIVALENAPAVSFDVELKSANFTAEFGKVYVVSNSSQSIPGNGVTGAFPISFAFANSADLEVKVISPLSEVTVLESPLHYNVLDTDIYLQGGPFAWISDGGFGGLEVGWTLVIELNNLSVTLPPPDANKIIDIKKLGSNLVTLVRSGSEKIDDVASNKSLTSAKESVTLISDGVDWFII